MTELLELEGWQLNAKMLAFQFQQFSRQNCLMSVVLAPYETVL